MRPLTACTFYSEPGNKTSAVPERCCAVGSERYSPPIPPPDHPHRARSLAPLRAEGTHGRTHPARRLSRGRLFPPQTPLCPASAKAAGRPGSPSAKAERVNGVRRALRCHPPPPTPSPLQEVCRRKATGRGKRHHPPHTPPTNWAAGPS